MAQKSTIFKVLLNVSDMDRHLYEEYHLTLAQHPSENDLRMMVRVLAFALNAGEQLQFCKGLSTDDEPALWQKSLSDEIELWIDVGQPDESRVKKACGRARQVRIYCYGGNSADIWWQQHRHKFERFDNLTVINIQADQAEQLASLVQRGMHLQCSVQDGDVWFGDQQQSVNVSPELWMGQ